MSINIINILIERLSVGIGIQRKHSIYEISSPSYFVITGTSFLHVSQHQVLQGGGLFHNWEPTFKLKYIHAGDAF